MVLTSLTEKGKKAYRHHEDFHKKMIEATIEGMSTHETEVLVKALTNLREFFNKWS